MGLVPNSPRCTVLIAHEGNAPSPVVLSVSCLFVSLSHFPLARGLSFQTSCVLFSTRTPCLILEKWPFSPSSDIVFLSPRFSRRTEVLAFTLLKFISFSFAVSVFASGLRKYLYPKSRKYSPMFSS